MNVPVGRLNLLTDKMRFGAAVGGVAFVVALVLLIQALYAGYRESARFFVQNVPTDLWVGQAGSFDLYRSTSIIHPDAVLQLSLTSEVLTIGEIRGRQARFTGDDGVRMSTLFISFAPAIQSQVTPVLQMEQYPAPGQIAISDYVAKKTGLVVGDKVMVADHELTVSEVLEVKSPPFGTFSIIDYDEANAIFDMEDNVTYVLVQVQDQNSLDAAITAIQERVPGLSVHTKPDFADNSSKTVTEFLPVIGVILAMSYLVGIVITGLTIYTATVEKTRDYGVLKAIGARNSFVYGIVIYQSMAVSIIGFAIGLPMALGASLLAESSVPEFITEFNPTSALITFVAVLAMGIFASVLPVRRITSIDPAMVFRA